MRAMIDDAAEVFTLINTFTVAPHRQNAVVRSPREFTDYISFGGDLRERVEVSANTLLGFSNRGVTAYDLHRLLLFGDVHYDGVQVFIQLGNETEAGRAPEPVPTDIDRSEARRSGAFMSRRRQRRSPL